MKRKILCILMMFALALPVISVQASSRPKLKLNKSKITIIKGVSYKLKTIIPSKAKKWESKNKKIATVSSKGVVKGKKVGSTYIIAKSGRYNVKCKVTVKKTSCKSIIQYGKTCNLIKGEIIRPYYEMINAESGAKCLTDEGKAVEIYKYSTKSKTYKKIKKTKKVSVNGISFKTCAIKKGYILYLDGYSKSTKNKIIKLFKKSI